MNNGIKENYTIDEWLSREKFYIDKLTSLSISNSPTTKEILNINSLLDKLATMAIFEFALLKRKEQSISFDIKNYESEMFTIIKKEQLISNSDSKMKITENDVKGLVKTKLSNTGFNKYPAGIYNSYTVNLDRYIFMEQVLKILSDKRSSIMSALSALKIEESYSVSNERLRK